MKNPLSSNDIAYLEERLGYQLTDAGVERAAQLISLDATLDEVVEAFTLL